MWRLRRRSVVYRLIVGVTALYAQIHHVLIEYSRIDALYISMFKCLVNSNWLNISPDVSVCSLGALGTPQRT